MPHENKRLPLQRNSAVMQPGTAARRREPNLAAQVALFTEETTPAQICSSATYTADCNSEVNEEDVYLCAWLRSRLERVTLTLREESALTVTPAQQRQIARLLTLARARSLDIATMGALRFGRSGQHSSRKVAC